MTSTSRPISRNSTELSISSITSQNEKRYSRTFSLIAVAAPRLPITSPASTTAIGPDMCSRWQNA